MTFYRLGNDLFARAISAMLAISIYLTIEFVNLKIIGGLGLKELGIEN